MDRLPSKVDLGKLRAECEALPFSRRYDPQVDMSSTQGAGVASFFGPAAREAMNEIAELRGQPVLHVMCNRLLPQVYVPHHVDYLPRSRQGITPRVERWHLPITTDVGALVNGEHLEVGYWHGPVKYWELHDVQGGCAPRIHLIVDLDNLEPQGSYGS